MQFTPNIKIPFVSNQYLAIFFFKSNNIIIILIYRLLFEIDQYKVKNIVCVYFCE